MAATPSNEIILCRKEDIRSALEHALKTLNRSHKSGYFKAFPGRPTYLRSRQGSASRHRVVARLGKFYRGDVKHYIPVSHLAIIENAVFHREYRLKSLFINETLGLSKQQSKRHGSNVDFRLHHQDEPVHELMRCHAS